MLLLSRKQNERIFIDDGPDKIEVCVVDIRGDTVRLGFTARRDIPILRGELVEWAETHRDGLPVVLGAAEGALKAKAEGA